MSTTDRSTKRNPVGKWKKSPASRTRAGESADCDCVGGTERERKREMFVGLIDSAKMKVFCYLQTECESKR